MNWVDELGRDRSTKWRAHYPLTAADLLAALDVRESGGSARLRSTTGASGLLFRLTPWVQKYGGWAILVLGAIPNPVFDLAGIAAGVTRLPLPRFLVFCWVGQCIKMTMFAFAGDLSLPWLAMLV